MANELGYTLIDTDYEMHGIQVMVGNTPAVLHMWFSEDFTKGATPGDDMDTDPDAFTMSVRQIIPAGLGYKAGPAITFEDGTAVSVGVNAAYLSEVYGEEDLVLGFIDKVNKMLELVDLAPLPTPGFTSTEILVSLFQRIKRGVDGTFYLGDAE